MRDDPVVRSMEQTGYPPWHEEETAPICPICGEECDTYYFSAENEIIGCDNCVEARDAWEIANRR